MLSVLIQKELKAIILSPKFTATFVICSLLMLLSVYIGIQESRNSTRQYDVGRQLIEEGAREANSWNSLRYRTYRAPDPMMVFVSGLNYDIGRWSAINSQNMVKLRNSSYSDDPIFAVFRFVDFCFIVQVVLSLFAIMFTYDAVNGEREEGTLKLVFANSVPRARYIFAKCIGGWLGLVIPICLPILLSVLLVMLFDVPFGSDHWLRLITLIIASIAYFSFFIILGVLISSITKRSSVSFLLSLVAWIVFV
ncbi:MAG: ABC transporter permease subunit, partial [Candidatus Zixiibacteriota bacterium]